MTTLRILVDGMPDADRALAWAVVDAGRVRAHGTSPPREWPKADATLAIVDAPLAHVAALALPPIPGTRLDDAIRYALDDQLAAAADTLHIAHGPQDADGRVVAVAASRALVEAIDTLLPPGARIVALPTLLPRAADWQWVLDSDGHGFLARPDGSAVAVPSAEAPPEILLALKRARRAATPPARIVVHARDTAAALPAPSLDGVMLVRGATFAWDGSGTIAGDPSAAPDLRPRPARAGPSSRADARRAWRLPIALAAAALAFFVVAALGTWLDASLARWQDEREALALAREAGAPARDFAGAMQAIAARYSVSRHAAHEAAPGDALTLLARAAPALAGVPAGQWKRAVYAGGAWTFEFAALGDGARDALLARLTAAGVTALAAKSASGLRVRIES